MACRSASTPPGKTRCLRLRLRCLSGSALRGGRADGHLFRIETAGAALKSEELLAVFANHGLFASEVRFTACVAGCEAHFASKDAVISKNGKELFRFERSTGGLYSKKMTVRSPASMGASANAAEAAKPQPEAPGFTRRGHR